MSEHRERRMNAYYYSFDETGCDPIDDILEAVAHAGKAFHHTDQWSNPDFGLEPGELCEADKIQNIAVASANAIAQALAAARAEAMEEAAKIADAAEAEADALSPYRDSLQLESNSKASMAREIADSIRRAAKDLMK